MPSAEIVIDTHTHTLAEFAGFSGFFSTPKSLALKIKKKILLILNIFTFSFLGALG